MNTLLRRRALAIVAGGAVALSTAVAVTPAASAAPNSEAAAVRWLEKSLTGNLAVYAADWSDGGKFTDYGLSLDVSQALTALDARPSGARVVKAVSANLGAYVAAPGGGSEYYGGSAGKFVHTVITAGMNPRDVDGRDVVSELEEVTGANGETTGTYGGVGQAWATRGLVAADSPEKTASAEFLAAQQCENHGGFRQVYDDKECPAAVAVDTTAFSVVALSEARASGIAGLDGALDRARVALLSEQRSDGSFIGDGTPNTNSTGVAAQALDVLGESAAAVRAAKWVARHQLTDATATGKLAGNAGAIAYDQLALTTARQSGIDGLDVSQWLRATAQAAPALKLLAAPGRTAVTAPRFGAARKTIKVVAAGLEPGWRAKATVSGGTAATAVTAADGRATFTVRLPKGTATRTVTVSDANGRTVGIRTVSVLAAKKLAPKVKKKVKRKKVQRVVVSGLVPRERVQVRFRGKVIKRGAANSRGNFVHRFRVGGKVGKTKVVVRGGYSNRTGSKVFRVVK